MILLAILMFLIILVENMVKLENQSKIFDYIKVDPSTINVTRNISDEELEQYYQDFSASFMEPEKRDVSYISLSLTDVEAKIVPSQSEIEAYYASNKENLKLLKQEMFCKWLLTLRKKQKKL